MSDTQDNKVEIEVFGDRYVLVGDSSAEDMQRIAQEVNNLMIKLSTRNARLGKSQLAILVALNLADELDKLRGKYQDIVQMLEP